MMNILYKSILTVSIFAGSITTVAAQKQFGEGTISYDIAIEATNADAPIAGGLSGAELTLYLKPTVSRSEMKSSLGVETNVYDSKAGKGFILKEYSGQKLMISTTRQNWLQKNQWNDNMRFTISNELQEIAGYKCKKAVGSTTDGKTFTVYFTPDIVLTNKQYNNSFEQLPGLPVQYELQSGNLVFKYTLKKISDEPVAAAKFDAPKSGFRVMTYEENQQLKKGK
ncbi:MAG: hypothetical protein JWQ27_860 [Ferruginibacter sp.]|nr:hypothetical protein [Ferruginibacter sp.]